MEKPEQSDVPATKQARLDTDYSLCIICQETTEEALVENPTAHGKVLEYIVERASYGDHMYPEIRRRLGNATEQSLVSSSATWHRTCYQDTVHAGMCKRAKQRYEKKLANKDSHQTPIPMPGSTSGSSFTRSQSVPYQKELCFFCENKGAFSNPLHKVTTYNAGKTLRCAIEHSRNDKLLVKLSTAIDPKDAHAIDTRYHKLCWATNVTNFLSKVSIEADSSSVHATVANEVAVDIEFLSLVERNLLDGNVLIMASLHETYVNIRTANHVQTPDCYRKKVKQLLQAEIPDVEFHKPKHANESERVSIKETRDAAIQLAEDSQADMNSDIKILYDAAHFLRKAISRSESWEFRGSLADVDGRHVPTVLYSFYRWVLQGPAPTLSTEKKTAQVDKHAMSLAQTTVGMCLSDRQISNKKSKMHRFQKEMPQKLAVGIAIRQAYRDKKVIKILHGFGLSVEYNRLLRLETQLASSVLAQMLLHDGVYIPPDMVYGRHIFFAVDNVDFAEDTPDGKNTLHATAMAIYQQQLPGDIVTKTQLAVPSGNRSIKDLPETVTELLECNMPKAPKPTSPKYPTFHLQRHGVSVSCESIPDMAWLLGRTLIRCQNQETPDDDRAAAMELDEGQDDHPNDMLDSQHEHQEEQVLKSSDMSIPTWSAYNSAKSNQLPLTKVGTPPLIAAPAHEWQTLLTVLKQAQSISTQVVGPDKKTIISLDMGLYKPAKQLQMSRGDLNHLILRPGELHIQMAQLRSIGTYIENSGIDFCWTEAGLYGPVTVKQILDGNHVKRGVEAHLTTLQALFMMYQTEFFYQHPDMQAACVEKAELLNNACSACADGNQEDIKVAHSEMVHTIESLKIMEEMCKFDAQKANQPLFQVIRQYMQMVMEMLLFIGSVRTGNWEMHLSSLEVFTKYFFAHDKLNYARMIPVYLADMKELKTSDPAIYEELLTGNWVVNKNAEVPFCAIGADHGLEQVNRSMKVSGGLVGITLNPSARTRFFLISPELAKLANEAQSMAGVFTIVPVHHHELSDPVLRRQESNIQNLTSTLNSFTNPFTVEGDDIFNLATKVIMPEKVKHDLCRRNDIGKKLFEEFVSQRITTGNTNVWAPMKKTQLQVWKNSAMTMRVKVGGKEIELKEDRSLFARMLVVSKSRPDINVKEAIGHHEFSVVPRSLFAGDGSMLHCSDKSALMKILEELPKQQEQNAENIEVRQDIQHPDTTDSAELKVAIVDGMAEVQTLDKPVWVNQCSDIAKHFSDCILEKYNPDKYDEVHLVFDRYDVPQSLKTSTRERRQGGKPPVAYRITDTTNIARVPMKQLISHVDTKKELCTYFAHKTLECARGRGMKLVVAWSNQCKATHKDVEHLASEQEEADTKLLLHAVDATVCGATKIHICSPDTDVLVLALRRYPQLCQNSYFVTGAGRKHRSIPLKSIYEALGPSKAAALPGFHAFTGADITGSFAGKGKITCWKAFHTANEDILSAFADIGCTQRPSTDTFEALEMFVCQLYLPHTSLKEVKDVRWWLFRKKQAQAESLPPTKDALVQAVMRTHYQSMIWCNDIVANPQFPLPDCYGWKLEGGTWKEVMTTQLPAPEAVIHLVKCGCIKTRCTTTSRCKCKQAALNCTDLCSCSDMSDEDLCDNAAVLDNLDDAEDTDDEFV